MKKTFLTIAQLLLIAVLVVGMGIAARSAVSWHDKYVQESQMLDKAQHTINTYETEEKRKIFDVNAIEQWCGNDIEQSGKVRMMGATLVETDGTLHTLEDESGERWLVDSVTLADNDNVLLWIHDNNTPTDATDDVVVKVFVEAHN